jgi:hypothetical protein
MQSDPTAITAAHTVASKKKSGEDADSTPVTPHGTDALDEALEESFPASDPLPVQPGTCIEGID